MPSLLQRFVNLFDLRLLVWLPGLWFIFTTQLPDVFSHLDRQIFFTAISLSPGITPPAPLDVVELSEVQARQLFQDPASDDELLRFMDYLAATQRPVGVIVSDLPRQDVVLAEKILQYAEPDSAMYDEWQVQHTALQNIHDWLRRPDVIIGSAQLLPHINRQDAIPAARAPWENYYQWLPSPLHPQYDDEIPARNPIAGGNSLRILPLGLSSSSDSLTQSLLWRHQQNWYPTFALAMMQTLLDTTKPVWYERHYLRWPNVPQPYPVSPDGSVVPAFQIDSPVAPTLSRYSLAQWLAGLSDDAALSPESMLLIGLHGDPALVDVAGLLQSVQANNYYTLPWWFYGAEKILLLLGLVYLLVFLPKVSSGVAMLNTVLVLLMLLVFQLGWQITQMRWLPLGLVMQYIGVGYLVMSFWRLQQKPQQKLQRQHQEVACQLSQRLLQQGQLEQALDVLTHCQTSERVLQLLYDIGGQHERKRRVNDALGVYRVLAKRKGNFKDVAKRIKLLSGKHYSVTEDKDLALSKTIVLADPHSRPQFGRYNIERELGRGAMGVVYLGHDPQIARRVAIKTLDYSLYDTNELVTVKARFFREAEAAGRLRHPNIVTVYDVGEEHDLAFIAMDYVAGQPLSDFISAKNLLPVQQVYRIVADVAEALAYAHSKQIVHRDIKPGNILYHPDSKKVTVTDFGIARIVSDARTQTGEIVGSPLYMSPEQVKGQKVGVGSDIFSLGVTFFQLLTGELPFKGDNIAGLSYQIIHGKHKNIRDVRAQLPGSASRIINKALQKEPADRYPHVADMARSLRNALKKDF